MSDTALNDTSIFEERLGHRFNNRELLTRALTHSSYANENKRFGVHDNERLEFLGDSILGMEVAAHLFKRFPNMREGDMTRLRAELVCETSLAAIGEGLGLGDFLRLGRGEDAGGGRGRPSIVSDAFEAVLAATWLDGGEAAARDIVQRLVLTRIPDDPESADRDYKTELQELVQKKSGSTLHYEPAGESGPDHDKRFIVDVIVNGQKAGSGSGRSKKEAEQAAARAALEKC